MALHELAGKVVPPEMLTNIPRLISAYYTGKPDVSEARQRVAFGTSGHRGSSTSKSFNEAHILATTQAICRYRELHDISGPLFLGMDTHALSEPAHATALEVLAANGVCVRYAEGLAYTPTPAVSHAILAHNRGGSGGASADGIVVTPSHNPPGDGGFKYNPPSGGPADTDATGWIEREANAMLADGNRAVKRVTYAAALRADTVAPFDFITPYVEDLANVIDMDVVKGAGLRIAADALGGAGLGFWAPIAERYGLDIEIRNGLPDPTFRFMTVDKDGKVRMDCSSPCAMASLIELKDDFDIAFGNDTDFDRHGIVTPTGGLMNPNHYLAVAIAYLFEHRPGWRADAAVGKTLVSSSMIDRVANKLGRRLAEVPVGFKWFVNGLLDGSYGFGGEESAGASFLRQDGTVWVTDKDGIILDLLAVEITARTGSDPSQRYEELVAEFGRPVYERIDAPATPEQKAVLKGLSAEQVQAPELAGEPVTDILTRAPANDAAIGGVKVVTDNGWFAARPSGTEDIYKIYAESFVGEEHLRRIQDEAQAIVSAALQDA